MRLSAIPFAMADRITELTAEQLRQWGVRLLMLDFDNTLVPYTTDVPAKEVSDWLTAMKQEGIQLCVVSNSKKPRVKIFCGKYELDCITHAKKPFSRGIVECMKKYQVSPKACALVGDQIYTDTLGANGTGVKAILVNAIDNHNFWLKARHVLEMPFILIAKKRSILL